MSTDVKTVEPHDSAEHARELMKIHGVHHLIVMRDHHPEGIVSDRDLGGPHAVANLSGRLVLDVMTPNPIHVNPETSVREAANLLRGHMIGCLPVMEKGRLVGIVTITDLLTLLGRGAAIPRRTVRA